MHLAGRDLRVRYAQHRFGPWMSTLALIALLSGTSIAVSVLGESGVQIGFSQLAISLTMWLFFSGVLNESAEMFESERSLMLNTKLTPLFLVFRVIWRNVLIGLHNLSVVIIISVSLDLRSGLRALLLPLMFVAGAATIVGPAFLLARVCLRHREISKLIPAFVQIVFFVTPILWTDPGEGLGHWIVNLNPLAWPILVAGGFISSGQIMISRLIWTLAAIVCSLLVAIAATRGADKDKVWL